MKTVLILTLSVFFSIGYSNNKTFLSNNSDTICGKRTLVHPNSVGTGHWLSSSNNVIFKSTNSITSTTRNDSLISSIYNSDQGMPLYVEIFWFYNGNSNIDTFRISFAQTPTANIYSRNPYCYGDTALITPTSDLLGNPNYFIWSFNNGIVEVIRPNITTANPLDSIYMISWDTIGDHQFHVIQLCTRNSWGCISDCHDDTIWEPTPVYPLDSLYPTSNMQANGTIYVFPIDSISSSYLWLDSQFASNSTATVQHNLMSGIPYHVRFRYESWFPNIFCTDTLTYILTNINGIEHSEFNQYLKLNLFPNPCIGEFKIEYTSDIKIQQVEIINILGQTELKIYSDFDKITIKTLIYGNYNVRIITNKGIVTKPVTLMKSR